MKSKNYYEVLGIRPTASNDEIELAYRGRRTQYHPDKYAKTDEKTIAWATAEMQAVNEAYKLLSDTTARTVYDHEMVNAESDNDMSDIDLETENKEAEAESYAEQCLEMYLLKGALAKDRLEAFSAIQPPILDTPKSWKKSPVNPEPLPSDVHESVKRMKKKRVSGLLLLIFSALSLIFFPLHYIAWVLLISASLLILFAKPNEAVLLEKTRRRAIVMQNKSNYENELTVWDEKASGKDVHTYRNHVINTAKNYISFVTDQEQRAIRVVKKNVKDQLEEYLRRIGVRDSAIAGVGPSRKEVLIRHGIKSAADVKRANFIGKDGYKIPSIGESVYNYMLAWYDSCVEEFEADLSQGKLVEKLKPLFDEYTEKTAAYDLLTAKANHVLTQKISDMDCERLRLSEPMQTTMNALARAESNFKLLSTSRIGVVAVVATWVFVCTVVAKPMLEYLDNTSHTLRPSAQAISASTTPGVATAAPNISATTNPNEVPATSNVKSMSKPLEVVTPEPLKTTVNDATVASNMTVNAVLEKSERVHRPAELEVKQYVEPRPTKVSPTSQVVPSPARVILNGQWSGTLSCGAYVGSGSVKNPAPWNVPVSMEVNENKAEWKRGRSRDDYSEILIGSLKNESGLSLSGEGRFHNAPDKSWRTKVEGHLVEAMPRIQGSATIFSISGQVVRNCQVFMERG